MIDDALVFIADVLNDHLARQPEAGTGPHAALGALVDRDGALDPAIAGRVLLTLVNVERAQAIAQGKAKAKVSATGDTWLRMSEPIHLNLHLLVTATLAAGGPDNGYAAALGRLSATIGFFRAAEVMTPQSAPGLPEGIERLIFDFAPLDHDGATRLWASLGGGYLPSVLYRVRMVTIPADELRGRMAPITRIGVRTEAEP